MTTVQPTQPDRKLLRRVATASMVGTTIEWYDYFIYGTASALVLGPQFFPNLSPVAGTLAAFASFGAGFFARPLGGIVFGHFGDRVGRKSVLITTLLIMGLATFGIGLLPNYDTIGIWAPVLLVALRLIQGLAVGGEWGGAVSMVTEYAPHGKRGFYGSFPQMGNALGVLLAAGSFGVMSNVLTDAQFESWGWRVPFLVSILMLAVALYTRVYVEESPLFKQVSETASQEKMPLVTAIRDERRSILVALGMRFSENILGYIVITYSLSYATQQAGLPQSTALNAVWISAGVAIGAWCALNMLTDRVGRRRVYMAGCVFTALLAFPFFWVIDLGSPVLIVIVFVLIYSVGNGMMYGIQPAFFAELFSTRVRYTGLSLSAQLASVFAGGPTPFIAAALVAWAGGAAWPVALFLIAGCALSFVAAYFAGETYRRDLAAVTHRSDVSV